MRQVKSRDKTEFLDAVVKAARVKFITKGVDETSMADLGRALGVSKPTIYEVFQSKRLLVDAVFKSAAKDVDLEWIFAAETSPPPFSEFLDQTAAAYKGFLGSPRSIEVYQLVLKEGGHSEDLMNAFAQHLTMPAGKAVRSIISGAIARGECVALQVEVIQKMLAAPLYYIMMDRALFGANGMPASMACAYLDVTFAAMKSHLCVGHEQSCSVAPRIKFRDAG